MTPHPVPATPTQPVPGEARSSPQRRVRAAAAGRPGPGTGEADPATACRLPASPGRGAETRTPAVGVGASPVPSAGLHALAAKMSEDRLEEQVRDACKELGILRIHVYNSRGTTPGVPDDILIGPHGVLWRELKTAQGEGHPGTADDGRGAPGRRAGLGSVAP